VAPGAVYGYGSDVIRSIPLPQGPSIVVGHGRTAILTPDGELLHLPSADAGAVLRSMPPPLLVHAPATFRRLNLRPGPAFDLLELFAFVHPARAAAPTARGLALALEHPYKDSRLDAEVEMLADLAAAMLNHLRQARDTLLNRDAAGLAAYMGKAGWLWAPYINVALGREAATASTEPLKIWKRLPEWEDAAPLPPPSAHPVSEAEARARLAAGGGGRGAPPAGAARRRRRAAARARRLRRRGHRRFRAARGPGGSARCVSRSRHRNGQDPWLPGTGQRLG
jgi:ATP-dependent DNA helicase DinG